MIPLIQDLQRVLKDKGLSPESAAGYIGCSGVQIRRWLKGTSRPSPIYRAAIAAGVEKIKNTAL